MEGVRQVMTECWTHGSEDFFHLPTFVSYPLQYDASAALAWTLGGSSNFDVAYADGCHQCTGLVQINMNTREIERRDYYLMAHFSKYVDANAHDI